MVIKYRWILVLRMKVASALEGLKLLYFTAVSIVKSTFNPCAIQNYAKKLKNDWKPG